MAGSVGSAGNVGSVGNDGSARRAPARGGFTLVEVLVVLILMGIAVGLVAPAFLPPRRDEKSALATVIRRAQDIAAARGETVYLGIARSGDWRLDAGSTRLAQSLASGTLEGYDGPRAILVVSALGTCGFDVRSSEAARGVPIDPLTCEVVTP
jgi:prepilin-type N-terminal cleavage/methylation domain-containing protein